MQFVRSRAELLFLFVFQLPFNNGQLDLFNRLRACPYSPTCDDQNIRLLHTRAHFLYTATSKIVKLVTNAFCCLSILCSSVSAKPNRTKTTETKNQHNVSITTASSLFIDSNTKFIYVLCFYSDQTIKNYQFQKI